MRLPWTALQSALGFYNPQTGRWLNRDPIEETGGLNVTVAARNDLLGNIDPLGLSHKPGGPWHPPDPVTSRCYMSDDCEILRAKMWLFKKMIESHTGWECLAPPEKRNPGHWEEIEALWSGYSWCQSIYLGKNCSGPPPTPIPHPKPCEQMEIKDGCNNCKRVVVAVGAGAGACAVGYGIYKLVRTCAAGATTGPVGFCVSLALP